MSVIKLNSLEIDHFKGIEHFQQNFDGKNVVITGENETKKTTIKDAFHWLLFDKSSDGKPSSGKGSFGLRPHYKTGVDIPAIVVGVEAVLEMGGAVHSFRKEQTEKKVKGRIAGYPNQYYIDGAPVLKKEYDAFLEEYISEEVFKLLTDVFYFCGELHYLKRREFLVKFAENVGVPEGFGELIERAGGLSFDLYKKALLFKRDGTADREGYKKEAEKIPTRIETILEGMEHPAESIGGLEGRRADINKEIQDLKIERQGLLGKESERQGLYRKVNELEKKKIRRVSELSMDTSGVEDLLAERMEISEKVGKSANLVGDSEGKVRQGKSLISNMKENRDSLQSRLGQVREDYKAAKEKEDKKTCYACGQDLPEDKLAELGKKRDDRISELSAKGNELKHKVDETNLKVIECENRIKDAEKKLELLKIDDKQIVAKAEKRIAEIDEEIKERPTPEPEKDDVWLQLEEECGRTQGLIGEPVGDQLDRIEKKRMGLEQELEGLVRELAQEDRIIKDKAKVQELSEREKELGQLMADIEKELDQIKEYNMAYSKLVEEAVNDKFQVVKFKLFDIQVDGGIDDRVCEATADGTSWMDMSKGQSIRAGVDVINTLSGFYEVNVPLFIDEAESISLPLETEAQTIKLFMKEGVRGLEVNCEN